MSRDRFDPIHASMSGMVQNRGLDTPAFESCVNGDTHGSWVKRNYASLSTILNDAVATPYYAIDGTQYKLTALPVPGPGGDQRAGFQVTDRSRNAMNSPRSAQGEGRTAARRD